VIPEAAPVLGELFVAVFEQVLENVLPQAFVVEALGQARGL
jgi:hypothetical protein